MRTWRVISIIAENKPHAQHKIHLHTVTVCNTRPVSLFIIIILLFFFSDHLRVHVFQSNQSFQAIDFVDRTVPEKL